MMVIHANAQILLLTAAVTATNGQLLDGCAYTNDGECDETRYCPPGSDTADCCEHGAPQVGVEAADVCCAATGCTNNYDWCRHARDGRCDEPRIGSGNCPMDSDATDCIAEEVDCSDMTTVLAEVNRKCCTLPSTSATAQSGHRRAQVGEECVLDTCSVECARVFVGMMNGCNAELTTAGADLSVLSEIAGAREFFRTCEQVLTPPGTGWVSTADWFIGMDPGMLQSEQSSGTQPAAYYWRKDPGNTGIWFQNRAIVQELEHTHVAPPESPYFGWTFDPSQWWVEEHGAIMETPDPLPPGKYKVVWLNDDNPRRPHCPPGGGGGSSCAGADGYTVPLIVGPDLSWSIGGGATLHSVTHMPCRMGEYTPATRQHGECMPHNLPADEFPVRPGARMPNVRGCVKTDYAVVFVRAYWG